MFNLPTLESALTGTIYASKLHFSPITDSTNTDALHAARTGAPHGSVYFADEQLAGRGRGDHAWHSAAGQGLYVSVLLRPPIAAARLPYLRHKLIAVVRFNALGVDLNAGTQTRIHQLHQVDLLRHMRNQVFFGQMILRQQSLPAVFRRGLRILLACLGDSRHRRGFWHVRSVHGLGLFA